MTLPEQQPHNRHNQNEAHRVVGGNSKVPVAVIGVHDRKGNTVKLDWLEPDARPLVESLTDPQVVAVCLYGEARSEPIQGIVAVANVIGNRVKKPSWWGKTHREVVLKPWQFSMWHPNGGAANYKRVLALVKQFAAKEAITDPGARECIGVAHLLLGDYLRDNTKGSTHYHTATMQPRPAWSRNEVPVVQIGGHVFYAGIK